MIADKQKAPISIFTNNISDILRDLVRFVQFKKREKHPWKSVTFSKVACYKAEGEPLGEDW